MTTPFLEVEQLVKSYEGRRVVDGLSFNIMPGEIVGLLGPNGAGKTTAFYITMGLLAAEAGKVSINSCDATLLSVDQRAKMGLGYLAQEPSIFSSLTVEDNLVCILELLALPNSTIEEIVNRSLNELHLVHLRKKRAASLSGGERRRLEISRALLSNPSCLLLDEPFANIDPISVEEVKGLVRHLKNKGISVLITDHNAREIFTLVDRSYLVYDGKVLCSGSVDALLQNPEVRRSYLGEHFSL